MRSRWVLAVSILLAGCAGGAASTPAAIGGPSASWMGSGAAQHTLLYVSQGNGVVNVYRYWQQTLEGVLTGFTTPLGECVDASGDVYIADYDAKKVFEYAHGAKTALRTINTQPYRPHGCAVDYASGDLAVANWASGDSGGGAGSIAVYRHGTGTPTIFNDPTLSHFRSCSYDGAGNLLATNGDDFGSSYGSARFAYLPNGGKTLVPIELPGPSSSWKWISVENLQWDGSDWVVNSEGSLYRESVSGSLAQFEGLTPLYDAPGTVGPVWLYAPKPGGTATQLAGGWIQRSGSGVGIWRYPAGSLIASVTKGVFQPSGVTISLKR